MYLFTERVLEGWLEVMLVMKCLQTTFMFFKFMWKTRLRLLEGGGGLGLVCEEDFGFLSTVCCQWHVNFALKLWLIS